MSRMKFKSFKTPTKEPVRVLSSDGFSIAWVYPEWTELAEILWQSAYSQGCISKDMSRVGMSPMESIAYHEAQEEVYYEQVKKAMQDILEEGDEEKIDTYGKPKITAIADIVGEAPKAELRNKIFKELVK